MAFAAKHANKVEACVAKPGFVTISGGYIRTMFASIFYYTVSMPRIDIRECSAAALHEILQGFSKDPLENEDLVRIGRQRLTSNNK